MYKFYVKYVVNDDLDNANLDMKHDSPSIDKIIDNITSAIPSYAKSRDDTNLDYSMNFVDVVSTYINDVNKFNTQVFIKSNLIDSLSKANSSFSSLSSCLYISRAASLASVNRSKKTEREEMKLLYQMNFEIS